MSLTKIESELEKLSPGELRQLALKSWPAFVEKEGGLPAGICDESDSELLIALDNAIERANSAPGAGHTGEEMRARLNQAEAFARLANDSQFKFIQCYGNRPGKNDHP